MAKESWVLPAGVGIQTLDSDDVSPTWIGGPPPGHSQPSVAWVIRFIPSGTHVALNTSTGDGAVDNPPPLQHLFARA